MAKIIDILMYPFRKWLSLFDRYVIKKFVESTIFVHIIIIAIAIVIDYSEKTQDFIDKKAPAGLIFQYYLNFIPYMGALLAPLLIFIAVIFFTSRMAYNSEIIAILNGGASFKRFLRPFIICGLFFSIVLLLCNHWLVPASNKSRYAFEEKYVRNPVKYGNNIHLKLNPSTLISLERYKFDTNEGTNFSLEKYGDTGASKHLLYKINATKIKYMPELGKWRFFDYKKWSILGDAESYKMGRQMDTILNMVPKDFDVDDQLKEALNYEEIESYIKNESQKGSGDLALYKVEQYRRTSSAISVLILTLMGTAIASRKIRGGIGLHLALGIGLSSLYVVFLQFSSTFSVKSNLHPLIGTNIPNIIFGIVAIILIKRAAR